MRSFQSVVASMRKFLRSACSARKLGQPSRKKAGWWQFHYEERFEKIHDGEKTEFALYSGLDVRIRDGVVEALRASLSTSN